MKDAIFEPYNPILGQWSGKHIPIIGKINRLTLDQLLSRASNLIVKQTGGEKFSNDEYALIDEIVAFCQSSFRDQQSTDLALNFLVELYSPMIAQVTKNTCYECGLGSEFENWIFEAGIVFKRLVTGDLPHTVLRYKKHPTGRPQRTIDLEVDVSDKRISALMNAQQDECDRTLQKLTEYGLCDEDLKIAAIALQDCMENFHESVLLSSSRTSLHDFVEATLRHELEISKRLIVDASTKEKREYFKQKAIVIESRILKSKESLQSFINDHQVDLCILHKRHTNKSYRNIFFRKEDGKNFTNYMTEFLRKRLIDIFKSKAYRKSHGDYGKEITLGDDDANIAQRSTKNDNLLSYFENNPDDLAIAQTKLTPRQWEALQLCMQGYNQKETAEKLNVSEACISQHMKKVRIWSEGIATS